MSQVRVSDEGVSGSSVCDGADRRLVPGVSWTMDNEKDTEELSQPIHDPAPEYPFATSPFCDEPRPPEIARDQTVTHTTVGGRGVIGRIK